MPRIPVKIADGPVAKVEQVFVDDKPLAHHPHHEPQPIADQIMAGCICGWRTPVSLHNHLSRQELWTAVKQAYEGHLS